MPDIGACTLRVWTPFYLSIKEIEAMAPNTSTRQRPWESLIEKLITRSSWPFVFGVLGLVFLMIFYRPISELIRNIEVIKLPGGGIEIHHNPPEQPHFHKKGVGAGRNRKLVLARISNLIQTSRPSGGLERLYS